MNCPGCGESMFMFELPHGECLPCLRAEESRWRWMARWGRMLGQVPVLIRNVRGSLR